MRTVADFLYPRGGWTRAARYVAHRVKRLPDPAHKISRGIAAGVFVCFTPFFGLHFLVSAGLAVLLRANVVAALLATFAGNPVTFPIIASISVDLGALMLGQPTVPFPRIFSSFSFASVEIWANFRALFTPAVAEWSHLSAFFHGIFLPYLIGGLLPGLAAAALSYALSRPVIAAYQKARIKRLKKRFEKRQDAAAGRSATKADVAFRRGKL